MAYLNLDLKFLISEDTSSNPLIRNVDRTISTHGVIVGQPLSYPLDPPIPAGGSATIFDGSRTIGLDGTTQLALTLAPLAADRYRLTWTGIGANPAFRTERAFGAGGNSLTLTLNSNLTVTITGSGPTYTNAQVGDVIVIPGLATGDPAGPFSQINVGYFTVFGVTSSSLTVVRAAGWGGATTETVAVASNDQFIVMSPDRVQVGDQVELSAVFSTNARRVYPVIAVTPRWIDIQSTIALANETAIPGANGLAVYSAARQMLYVEVNQLVALRLNGATTDTDILEPQTWVNGTRKGLLLKTGPVWRCIIVNKSSVPVGGIVIAVP